MKQTVRQVLGKIFISLAQKQGQLLEPFAVVMTVFSKLNILKFQSDAFSAYVKNMLGSRHLPICSLDRQNASLLGLYFFKSQRLNLTRTGSIGFEFWHFCQRLFQSAFLRGRHHT